MTDNQVYCFDYIYKPKFVLGKRMLKILIQIQVITMKNTGFRYLQLFAMDMIYSKQLMKHYLSIQLILHLYPNYLIS